MTAAVILAGGSGQRFRAGAGADANKLMAPFRGRPILDWAVDAARGARLDEVVVVLGSLDPTELHLPSDVTVLVNEAWANGQATSLQTGLELARDHHHGSIVVGLGDQPLIRSEAWGQVAAATDSPIAVATYHGRRAHPVRLASTVWPELPPTGDFGARHLLAAHPELVTEVPCTGVPADIDTVEDLSRWS